MTDRELLELAAKGAGYDFKWESVFGSFSEEVDPTVFDEEGFGQFWNPIDDDGDAFRLAVKLRIKSRYNEALGQALAWRGGAVELDDNRANIEDFSGDECACARYAIVRAAAEIGKAMP